MHGTGGPWTTYLPVLLLLAVLALRLRGATRARRLRLETLWVVPAVLLAALAASLAGHPPREPLGWVWLAFALGIGLGVGWRRGKLMRIAVDPATHRLNQQASPAALLLAVLLVAARQGLAREAAALGLDMLRATGLLLALMTGVVAATRVEMFLRARALLAAHPLGSSPGPTTSR